MALTSIKKGDGSGGIVLYLGTDNTTNPNNERYRIIEIWQNRRKFLGLDSSCIADMLAIAPTNLISAAFGLGNIGGGTWVKNDAGGGWFECWLSSTSVTGVIAGKVDCFKIRINKAAYDALAAAGKADLDNASINPTSYPFN